MTPALEEYTTAQLLSHLVTRFYIADGLMADYAQGQIRGLRTMIEHYEPLLMDFSYV